MASVRSHSGLDRKLHAALSSNGIPFRPWAKVETAIGAVEVDALAGDTAFQALGCFWHGCRRHRPLPSSNARFWTRKIHRNRIRDRRTVAALKAEGLRVVEVWEHDLVAR